MSTSPRHQDTASINIKVLFPLKGYFYFTRAVAYSQSYDGQSSATFLLLSKTVSSIAKETNTFH